MNPADHANGAFACLRLRDDAIGERTGRLAAELDLRSGEAGQDLLSQRLGLGHVVELRREQDEWLARDSSTAGTRRGCGSGAAAAGTGDEAESEGEGRSQSQVSHGESPLHRDSRDYRPLSTTGPPVTPRRVASATRMPRLPVRPCTSRAGACPAR